MKLDLMVLVALHAVLAGCGASEPEPTPMEDARAAGNQAADAGASEDGSAGSGPDARTTDASGADATSEVAEDATASSDDGGARNRGVRVGEFSLQLVPPEQNSGTGLTKLLGKVWDNPVPDPVRWTELAEAEGCVLSAPDQAFCEESCGSAVCVEDDVCQAYPTALDVGAVTVAGVRTSTGASEFTSEPTNASYQLPADLSLPYPAFEEGAALELTAAGGELGPFTIEGTGIAPLVLEGSDEGFPLMPGAPLSLSWEAPGASANSRVQVKLDISHHGGAKGVIECDVEDDGELTIPAALTDALVDLGVAGFPTVMVTRSSVGSVETRVGRIDLKTYTDVKADILIPGLVSCSGPEDCPEGQSCLEGALCG